MTDYVSFTVHGSPQPAGSKTAIRLKNGRTVIVDGKTAGARSAHATWRDDVKQAALEALDGREPFDGPVRLRVTFFMPTPKSLSKRAWQERTARPTTRPDTTKLLRGTEDAMTAAGVWRDDSQVVDLVVSKQYAWALPPHAIIVAEPIQ